MERLFKWEKIYAIDMTIKVIYMLFYKLDISPKITVFPNVAITFFLQQKVVITYIKNKCDNICKPIKIVESEIYSENSNNKNFIIIK
jgi:hypothetical protein